MNINYPDDAKEVPCRRETILKHVVSSQVRIWSYIHKNWVGLFKEYLRRKTPPPPHGGGGEIVQIWTIRVDPFLPMLFF